MPLNIVAFVGLGNMGLPMANNLAAAGYTVHGFDPQLTEANAQTHAGIALHSTLAQCVRNADFIFTMLPNGSVVLDALKTMIKARSTSTTVFDCSTIDINDAREAHQIATDNGYTFYDAPVSGGTKGAATGTLTAMVGGDEKQLEQLRKLLEPLFDKVIYCGDAGNGQAAKICNNMLLAASMIATGETFNLGKQLGLDAQTLFDILSSSTGSCWSVNSYCPVPGVGPQSPADNGYQPGFSGHMMLKDMKLTQAAASSVDVATPLGAMSTQLYNEFVENGGGDTDFSAIIEHLKERSR